MPSEPIGVHGEPPPLIIGEAQAPLPQLAPQNAILFDQVSQGCPFPRSNQAVTATSNICRAELSIMSGRLYHGRNTMVFTTGRLRNGTFRRQHRLDIRWMGWTKVGNASSSCAVVMRVALFIDRVNVDRVVRPMESAAEA
jgi:hypothetical protein